MRTLGIVIILWLATLTAHSQIAKVQLPTNPKLVWIFSTELLDNKKVAVWKQDTLFVLQYTAPFKDLQQQSNSLRVVEYQNKKITFRTVIFDKGLFYYKQSKVKGVEYYAK